MTPTTTKLVGVPLIVVSSVDVKPGLPAGTVVEEVERAPAGTPTTTTLVGLPLAPVVAIVEVKPGRPGAMVEVIV